MPSVTHELLVELFRASPVLAAELVGRVLALEVPDDALVRVASGSFSTLSAPEYRADVVVRIEAPGGGLLHSIIVEIQLARDPEKRYAWPLYVTAERARKRCPATLVVIALSERMARWCAQPIELDQAGNRFRPLVIGPAHIPVVTEVEAARAWPELAVLSAAAHGRVRGAERIALAALAACVGLDDERATLYADFIAAGLGEAARRALEELMSLQGYEYQSDFAKRYVEEGRKEGHKEGIEEGRREILVKQLGLKFGALSAEVRDRIQRAERERLDLWLERVLTAESLDELFAGS